MSNDEFQRAWDNAWMGAEARSWVKGRLGRINTDGTVTIKSGRAGFVHVSLGEEGEENVTIARNMGVALKPWLPIRLRLEPDKGYYVIYGVDPGSKLDFYTGGGDSVHDVGPHTHAIRSGLEYPLEPLRFNPGRPVCASALDVSVKPFRYYWNGTWDTYNSVATIDLTSYLPASTKWCWILVGIDPSTNSLVAAKSADQDAQTDLTLDLIDTITFAGYIPCGAVQATSSDTSLTNIDRWQDARGWVNHAWLGVDEFFYLPGRSGGQVGYGSPVASETLTLAGSSNATPGAIILNPDGGGTIVGGAGAVTPDGTLHVHTASAGSVTASSSADNFVLENSSGGGMSFLVPDASTSAIVWGSPSSNYGAQAIWTYATKQMRIGPQVSGSNLVLTTDADTSVVTLATGAVANSIYVNSTGVGIGTTSPGSRLHVAWSGDEHLRLASTSATGNPFVSFYQTTTRRSFIQHNDTDDTLKLASEYGAMSLMTGTGGTEVEAIRIDSSRNVLIGTGITALQKLHLHTASSDGAEIAFTNTTTGTTSSDGAVVGLNASEQLRIWHRENSSLVFGINNATAGLWNSTGFIIGGSSPSGKLDARQSSTTAAIPTLYLQQADLSEEFIRFNTTVGAGNPINTTALGAYYGRVRVYVQGVGAKWLALYN